jgi:hypothetical protein
MSTSDSPQDGQFIAGDGYGGEVIADYHLARKNLTHETLTKSIRWQSLLAACHGTRR